MITDERVVVVVRPTSSCGLVADLNAGTNLQYLTVADRQTRLAEAKAESAHPLRSSCSPFLRRYSAACPIPARSTTDSRVALSASPV